MRRDQATVLVVDRDDDATREVLGFLRERGFTAFWARDSAGAFHVLDEERVDALVSELGGEHVDGMAVLQRARVRNPEVCAVMLIDRAGVDRGVEAMRQGAYDFQVRPPVLDKLLAVLERG